MPLLRIVNVSAAFKVPVLSTTRDAEEVPDEALLVEDITPAPVIVTETVPATVENPLPIAVLVSAAEFANTIKATAH